MSVYRRERQGGYCKIKQMTACFLWTLPNQKKKAAKLKRKDAPLHIDLILQSDSKIPPPKDIASHQVPNGRKLKRKQELQAQLEKRGILSRSEKLLQARLNKSNSKAKAQANNNPGRSFYDIWGEKNPLDSEHQGKDSWYLEQTKKSRVKHPDRLNAKPSEIPAIETVGSGSSYNPSFQSHQALLLQAHEVELKKLKEEEKIERQLKFPTAADAPTQESKFQELCEGLVEETEEMTAVEDGSEEQGTGPGLRRERKTERQRKKEKEAKFLRAKLQADKIKNQRKQSLFQLRSIQTALAKREGELARRKAVRAENRKKEALQPRRLGRLKYKEPEIDVLLSDELPESLRKLKPEGNIAMDRFKSFQKRNIIEPRERAKFHRKLKVKYVEKRAFREVTL
ncbi:NOP53 ribosome biogenesis factor L homeolog [Xenopus laevis]|uniref:Ribosome biogenesis protein NOP53 n=1 Tax=Xenopus laevis TaxID=8355 RepID=Q52KT8_XENLA|nr:NOP53 ribosome biogenesis factor L homeolog [Xenopus laevis]AAH94192.1 MGC115044 protein [Xenopus laevis]